MFTAGRNDEESDGDPLGRGGGADAPPCPAPAPAGVQGAAVTGPLWSRAYVELIVAQALFGFGYAVFVLLPKLLAVSYGGGPREIGLVMAAFGVVSLLVIPGIGPLVNRIGCRATMTAASLLLAGSALGMLLIQRAGWFAALLRGAQGVAWTAFFAAGMSIVVDLAPPARLGQAIGLFGGASLAMTALAPALAEPIAERFGPRAVFLLGAGAALLAAWSCRRLVVPGGTGAGPVAAAVADPHAHARARRAVLIVLAFGSLAAATMFTFVAPFALAHHIAVVRGFFISYTITALGVRFGSARLTDRFGHRRAAIVGVVSYGAVVLAMGALGPDHLIVLGALFGLAHGLVFPSLMALILVDTAPSDRARILALSNGAINVGIVALAGLGLVAERAGYGALLVGVGALTSASALLLRPRSRPAKGIVV